MVWCLIKGNESHGTVIQQNRSHPKYLYPIWLTFCLFYLFEILRYLSQLSFLNSRCFWSLLPSFSHSPNLFLSFSLYLSLAHSPLGFHLPVFYIKGNSFGQSVSLNKCISTNVPRLELTYHISIFFNFVLFTFSNVPSDGSYLNREKMLCSIGQMVWHQFLNEYTKTCIGLFFDKSSQIDWSLRANTIKCLAAVNIAIL